MSGFLEEILRNRYFFVVTSRHEFEINVQAPHKMCNLKTKFDYEYEKISHRAELRT